MTENGRLPDSDLAPTLLGGRLRKDAADSADRMFTKFALSGLGVLQAVSPADTYRTYDQQVQARARVGDMAAVPGTSNHGWGLAADLANGMNRWDSPAQNWFAEHGRSFGWVTPGWADPSSPLFQKNEPWHKEYKAELDKREGPKIRRPRGNEIGIGSTGAKVERIQRLLNQNLRGPNLVVDGKFGLGTAVAVARFQHPAHNVAVSGVVGSVTMAALEGRPVAPSEPVVYLGPGTQKHDQVRNLQRWLKNGFKALDGLVVDGDYGPRTVDAVKFWQGKAGLPRTGTIGPKDKARLDRLGVDL